MLQNITTVKRSGSNFFYSLIHCFVFAAAAPSIHSFSKFARPLPISLRLDRWATKEGLTLNAVIATSDRQILHSTPWINNTWLEVNSLSVKRCTQWQTALALTRCKKQPDNPPVCPDVTLSLSASLSHHANSLVHVTVAEDDERRLSSQLQRHLLQVTDGTAATGNHREERKGMKFHLTVTSTRRAVSWVSLVVPLHDLFANRCGAGEAQLADVRVVGQTLPHHATCRKEGDWEGWL